MLKVLGSMLILLASVGFGFQIQMDLKNHLRLLYDIRKLLFDIANETAYTMDPMEVVLEHAIHSRNPYLNEICTVSYTHLDVYKRQGPYILYTIVRIKSILNKYHGLGKDDSGAVIESAHSKSEKDLMLELSKFNAVMESAFEETAPHKILSLIHIYRIVT